MKFDVVAIVTDVAGRIIGDVDANKEKYENTDFSDTATQSDMVQKELEWLLDRKMPERQHTQLVEVVLEHPEMRFCFNICDKMIQDQMQAYIEAERAQLVMQGDYRRDVL